jgi:hypothetical protein
MVVLATGSACNPLDTTSSNDGSAPTSATPATTATMTTTTSATAAAPADGGDAARFCVLAKEKGAQNLEVFDAQSATPEQRQQVLRNIDAMTAAAPEEIHADFVRFDEFEHKLFDAGGNANGDLAQEAGGAELRDSLTRIADYLDKHCGIHN